MPVHRSARPARRTRSAAQSCILCGRAGGQGDPPLCAEHTQEGADEQLSEVIDEVLGHPQVRRVVDRAYGLLDQLAGVVDQVKRGEFPQRAPQQARTPGPNPVLVARSIFHFTPTEPLTLEKIRDRKRALAQLVHPDKGGTAEAMARINGASEVLLKAVKA